MKRVINAVVRIEYDWSLNCTAMEEKDAAAIDLAINPNFHSILNEVSLKSVNVEQVEDHLINWDKLENNPDFLYINQ